MYDYFSRRLSLFVICCPRTKFPLSLSINPLISHITSNCSLYQLTLYLSSAFPLPHRQIVSSFSHARLSSSSQIDYPLPTQLVPKLPASLYTSAFSPQPRVLPSHILVPVCPSLLLLGIPPLRRCFPAFRSSAPPSVCLLLPGTSTLLTAHLVLDLPSPYWYHCPPADYCVSARASPPCSTHLLLCPKPQVFPILCVTISPIAGLSLSSLFVIPVRLPRIIIKYISNCSFCWLSCILLQSPPITNM